ncbi:hypothetical protein ACO2Q1_11160 [Brevundimonas sp. VNH65]|uniref:hypothetical protein n=1 Tax=Brevundimonas sp. VNH65 TaxID=3400917 RepID=UPI003C049BC4
MAKHLTDNVAISDLAAEVMLDQLRASLEDRYRELALLQRMMAARDAEHAADMARAERDVAELRADLDMAMGLATDLNHRQQGSGRVQAGGIDIEPRAPRLEFENDILRRIAIERNEELAILRRQLMQVSDA